MLNHAQVPLFDATARFVDQLRAPFYSPGHKGGRTLPDAFLSRVAAFDLNNLPDTDTLHCPTGPILEAERLLADAYGVVQSFILVGGSTSGNIAAVLATCRPGDEILVQRNAHKSTIAGIVLAGAIPIWLAPEADPVFGILHGVSVEVLARAFDAHPEAVGAIVLNPTYFGTTGDIAALGAETRRRGKLLIVDEAHGAHFRFHPELPRAAEDAGADLIVQSTHKVLSGLSQAAVLHRGTDRVDEARIRSALQLTQTTSPSFPVMVSIDLARREMALHGREIWDDVIALARDARARLSAIDGVRVLSPADAGGAGAGFHALEETKIVFGAPSVGLSGSAWQRELNAGYGVQPELAGPDYLLCIMTVGSRRADVDHLVAAVAETVSRARMRSSQVPAHDHASLAHLNRRAGALSEMMPSAPLSPRDAFFARSVPVALEQTGGRIAAEVVTPYPPGIPVVMPGERITPDLVDFLLDVRRQGLSVSASDLSLRALLVIDDGD